MADYGAAKAQAAFRQQRSRRAICFGLFAAGIAAYYVNLQSGGFGPSPLLQGCAESDSAFIDLFTAVSRKTQPRVALYAQSMNKPGGRPVLDEDEAAESRTRNLPPKNVPSQKQYDAMERDVKFLKCLRGKFVRVGKKPWDPHQFTKTEIQVNFDAVQGQNTKLLNQVIEELRRITAVHPENILAQSDNATLKQRKGMTVGLKSTLKTVKNMDFLQRLNTLVLPRIRDFNGLWPNYFKGCGMYKLSIPTQEAFRELDELVDDREFVHNFKVVIHTNCYTHVDAKRIMEEFGFPFNPQPHRDVVVEKAVVNNQWVSVDKKKKQGKKR